MMASNSSQQSRRRIRNLAQYVRRVITISDAMNLPYGNLWFRGVRSKALDLVPGLIWRSMNKFEDSIVEEFRIFQPAYSLDQKLDPWEQYCFMQHHGLPTRLLDWTMQPLAALFFALDSFERQSGVNAPVVWVMNPYALNRLTQRRYYVYVPSTTVGPSRDVARLNSYLPDCLRPSSGRRSTTRGRLPIAVEPTFSNRRLIAQQGCFTIHGTDTTPINKLRGMSSHLVSIEVDPHFAAKVSSELEQLGFRGEWLYQDLDRLSKRIVREREP